MNQKVSGEERLAAICQALRQETLTPAEQEAETLLIAARKDAETIREEAKKEAEELKRHAKREIEKELALFHSSLHHAALQAVERLKTKIEHLLLSKGLDLLVQEEFQSTKALGSLLDALTQMVEKEGLTHSPEIWLGKAVDKKALLASLTRHTLETVKEEKIQVGSFLQGLKLVIKEKHMTLEITEDTVRELLSSLLKRDFRRYLFKEEEGTESSTEELTHE